MNRRTSVDRRTLLAATGTTLTGLLAGCSDSSSQSGLTSNTSGSTTETSQRSGTNASTSSQTPETTQKTSSDTHTVSMAPVGDVTLDAVPKKVAIYCPGYADMVVALGHADAINSVGVPSRYHTDVYGELDDVSLNPSKLTALYQGGIDKEVFFNLDSDLHLIDPNWLLNNFKGWKQSDIDQVRNRVAPFLGNVIFRRTDSWHDYQYYSMYEAFEKVAEVFQETERYKKFKKFESQYIDGIQRRLPGANERPNAVLLWQGKDKPETFTPYRLSGSGTNKKQFHDLKISDAFEGSDVKGLSSTDRGTIDYETLLTVDPDVIFLRGHEDKGEKEFKKTVLAYMKSSDTASRLSAVKNDNVFRGGPIYEGPIQNLFLVERFAKLVYPDVYTEEHLFDRSNVNTVITGSS